MLLKYAELGTSRRGDPCLEYPGEWLLHLPLPWQGKTEHSFPTLEDAKLAAIRATNAFEDARLEYDVRRVTVSWKCSDNDPRVGQVWFTGFYTHGRLNMFGNYKET